MEVDLPMPAWPMKTTLVVGDASFSRSASTVETMEPSSSLPRLRGRPSITSASTCADVSASIVRAAVSAAATWAGITKGSAAGQVTE